MKKILFIVLLCSKCFITYSQQSLFDKAYDFYDNHDFTSANRMFTLSIKSEPGKRCDSYGLRGLSRLFLGLTIAAKKDIDSAITICPRESSNYYNKGFFFAYEQQYDSAIFYYSKAIKLEPGNDEYYINRATAYGSIKDSVNAIKDLRKAISIDSSKYVPFFNLAMLYKNTKQEAMAIPYFERAYQRSPDNLQIVTNMAACYLTVQNYLRAFELCNDHLKDVQLKSDLIDFYIIRGQALFFLDKKEDACKDFNDLSEFDPVKGKEYSKKYCN